MDRIAILTICEVPLRRTLFMSDRSVIACKFQGNSGMPAALPPQTEIAGASSSCLRVVDLGSAKRGAGRWTASLKTSRRPKARTGLIPAGSCARSVCDSGGHSLFSAFPDGLEAEAPAIIRHPDDLNSPLFEGTYSAYVATCPSPRATVPWPYPASAQA